MYLPNVKVRNLSINSNLDILDTLFIGKTRHDFSRLASTNDYAIELLSKTKPAEGTVITADYQWAGRGQIGSVWQAAAGSNLLMSIILYPSFLPARASFLLNQVFSLAVSDAVGLLVGSLPAVKWPNDIYINGKKAGGLLVQNSLQGSRIQWSVVGIGLNVNQQNFDPSLSAATSLALALGHSFDRELLLAGLCQALERRYLQLRAGEKDIILRDYLNRLYRFGEDYWYELPSGERLWGRIVGVDAFGKLRLLHAQGESSFGLKEIIFL